MMSQGSRTALSPAAQSLQKLLECGPTRLVSVQHWSEQGRCPLTQHRSWL